MKRFIYACSVAALLLCGCAHGGKTVAEQALPFFFTEVSGGLPADGMWRQHLALHDMNADGLLDIVAPPARKAGSRNEPAIFLYDPETGVWREGAFDFPALNYGYGGIAVSDFDKDGNPDIAVAVHTGGIIILRNTGAGGFSLVPFDYTFAFNSRAIAAGDFDGDGRSDLVAFAEVSGRRKGETPPVGLLLGMNREGGTWEIRGIEASRGISGDSVATGDVNGDRATDILIAPLTNVQENKRMVWLNTGKGEFAAYEGNLAGELHSSVVRAGDINGDGKDDPIIIMTGSDLLARHFVYAFLWDGSVFSPAPSQMELEVMPAAMDVADVDGDSRKEVIVLYKGGIDILKYTGTEWVRIGHQKLPVKDSVGVYDLRAGVDRDGSVLVVYNLGNEPNAKLWNNGLRAYRIKPANGKQGR